MRLIIIAIVAAWSASAAAQTPVVMDCSVPWDPAKLGVGCRFVTDPIPGATTADKCQIWTNGNLHFENNYAGGTVTSRGDPGAPPAGTVVNVGCVFVLSTGLTMPDGATWALTSKWVRVSDGAVSAASSPSYSVTSRKPMSAPTNLRLVP